MKASTLPSISKEEIDRLLALYESEMVDDADNRLRQYTERIWATLTKEERIILTKYTQTYSYLKSLCAVYRIMERVPAKSSSTICRY